LNAVASLSQTFPVDATTLHAALTRPADWWGAGEAAEVVKDDPPKLTLAVPVDGERTRVMLVLNGAPGGTELMVMHTGFANGDSRDAHAALWEARLDRLADVVNGR